MEAFVPMFAARRIRFVHVKYNTLRFRVLYSAVAALLAVSSLMLTQVCAQGIPAPQARGSAQHTFIDRYCSNCHSGPQAAGGLALTNLDVAHPEQHAREWEKVLLQLRAGMMPPAAASHPDRAAIKAFTAGLETRIDRAAAAHPDPGSPALHRLNRTEYANSVRDLLDLDVDVNGLLPADDMSHGFDNMAEVLNVSPTLLAGYVCAASKISRAAIGDVRATPSEQIYHLPSTLSQTDHIEGTPFGTRGGIAIRHNFPADGEYVFKTTLYFTTNTFLFGMYQKGEQIEVAVNGERVALFDVNPMMKVDDDLRTPPLKVKAGPQTISVAFVQKAAGPVEDVVEPFDHTLGDLFLGRTQGLTGLPHIRDLSINGPYHVTGVSDTPSRRKIFLARPASVSEELPCATKILSALARHAYRRPVTDDELRTLLELYQIGRSKGDFEEGIRLGLQFLLSNPKFVFRFEGAPESAAAGARYRLTDLELASRLSYFLWSSGPDERLIALASQGKLRDQAVLEREVRRMLADPRSEALTANFAGEWLHLRNLKDIQPDLFAFPNINFNLLQSMRRETELFFSNLVHEDRDVMELLTADYTFVDENLAKHYQIPDIEGPRFRRVKLADENRRGLLGQASILTVTSFANRTSPVVRGKWVLDTLLGAPPPQPPANVPPLKEVADEAKLSTVRERLEEHRKNPACASCHTMMDPIGFALENYDATGAWRRRDSGAAIDTTGQLVDGTRLDGPNSLRRALVDHSDAFLSAFTQKLLTYALGRGVEYYDMPAVRAIDQQAAHNGNRFSAFVLGIVKSVPFQMRRADPRSGADTAQRVPSDRWRLQETDMFLTKKHLSRRTVLQGIGVTLALPLLDSMVAAATPLSKTAAAPRTRLAALEMVHGAAGSSVYGRTQNYWSPVKEGADFEFTQTLKSLEPFRDYVTVISDTDLHNAMSLSPAEEGADHTRSSAVFLTAAHPKMTEGSDILLGPSIDQIYAQRFGLDTPLPSLQLCIEDVGSLSGACGYGYSCVYANTISWATPTTPLPMERNPRAAFEQLFGDGGGSAERQARRQADRSVLDHILQEVGQLQKDLPVGDRNRLNEYLEDVREVERRIQKVEKYNASGEARALPEAPVGVPDSFEEHVKLMFDLQVLAFMTDVTRVSTFKMGRDVSARVYPESGVKSPFHGLSHHGERPAKIEEFSRLNQYHVSKVAYFLDRLRNTPDGDGNLLDHSLVLYGSPMGDSHVHEHKRLPLFLAGRAGGKIKGNNHLRCAPGTPMANVLLTVLHKLGVEQDRIGDSTGEVEI